MYVMCNTTRMHTGYRPGAALPRPSSALPARGGNCGLSRQHEAGVQLDRVCRQGSSPPPTELVTHPLCPNQSATDCRRVPRSDGYPGEYTTYSTSIYIYIYSRTYCICGSVCRLETYRTRLGQTRRDQTRQEAGDGEGEATLQGGGGCWRRPSAGRPRCEPSHRPPPRRIADGRGGPVAGRRVGCLVPTAGSTPALLRRA